VDTLETARAQSFALLIDLGTKLQVLVDRNLAPSGFTTRQWFLCVVLEQAGHGLGLGEAALRMGTSRQNAKQLALKLERKGHLRIERDPGDSRALRLSLTEACRAYWARRKDQDRGILETLFRSLTAEELESLHGALKRLDLDVHALLADDSLPFSKEKA